jgi:predicted nucleotidyltransferase
MMAVEHILRGAAAVLAGIKTPWALLGGWAVSIRTEPRFTRDVDLAVAVTTDVEAERVVRAFANDGYLISALVEQDAVHRLATVRLAMPEDQPGLLLDLIFASSGIEAEICRQADTLEILPGFSCPVARAEHLLALKVLARDDRTRPQDAADIRALLGILDEPEIAFAREALKLISQRGFDRGRNLEKCLVEALREFRGST